MSTSVKQVLLGPPRDVKDPRVFHRVSLIAFLAWVGLGADGLSSSAYGPEEAFRALGEHAYLAVGLALATAFTVLVISYAYSRLIEQFPLGGGGYVVATRLLGAPAGLVSGSALLVDYVLTISVSVASGADAVFSFLPPHLHAWKLLVEFTAIGLLVILNLRGVKESVTFLTPVFLLFVVTHVFLIVGVVVGRAYEFPAVVQEVRSGYAHGLATLGLAGMAALFLRAYTMGAGTYTGIEAVSNGLTIMREPKVDTGRRTMALMAVSLAFTAAGIIVGYLLVHATPVAGKTMNAVLAERFAGAFTLSGLPVGRWFVVVTLAAESLLLFVAAQAGFVDGPRVMANMALDSWLPHGFKHLSSRLTMQNGVLLMGGAAVLTLLYTGGDITALVTMYSINVFITFSLSQLGMCRFWLQHRAQDPLQGRRFAIHLVAFVLCAGILAATVYEKFAEHGWVTLLVTGALVAGCQRIRRHYQKVNRNLRRLDEILDILPPAPAGEPARLDPTQPTAVLLVGSYAGLGIHSLLTIQQLFPGYFKNFIFVSVGVIDSATFTGVEEVERVRRHTEDALRQYVELAHRLGLAADFRMGVATEPLAEATGLCVEVSREFPRTMVFAGKLIFEKEHWYQRLLHNETAYQVQRRLQFAGLNAMVLPVRILAQAT